MNSKRAITEKMAEAAGSVLPVSLIVTVLCLFLIPIDSGLMLSFLLGSVMLIAGMGLFTLGSENAMTPIGNHIGSKMTKSRNLPLILILSFLLGAAVTMSEPDLQVLAENVPAIDKTVLILTVSVGVGFFLSLCMLRILFRIPLNVFLLIFYGAVFVIALFSDAGILPVAFDAGGVTTGPMTVPFIMALGVGVASIRSDENAKSDSFGLIALCSVGPILSTLILNLIFRPEAAATETVIEAPADTVGVGWGYIASIPSQMLEVAVALLPIFIFFLLFQVISLRLRRVPFVKILIGVFHTYSGLVLFLTGANVGFSPLGYVLGGRIAEEFRYALIPLAVIFGWFIINAEPAVHILNKQVEELSAGAISAKAMGLSLSIAVSAAGGLSMLRVITGLPVMWIIVPGYLISLLLTFFVPKTFTAIAFDSGGVASGPLTATFMLPMAMGASAALGGNILTDAFGLVALVAMMPLITIQIMGAIAVIRTKKASDSETVQPDFADNEIIDLW